MQQFSPSPLFHSHRFRDQPGNGGSITAPPLLQLSLQSLNGLLHWPVLLFFLLVFLLPLLGGQLQVHCHSVSNGLGSNWRDGRGKADGVERRDGVKQDAGNDKRERGGENRTVKKHTGFSMEMGLHLINFYVNWTGASCAWRCMNREGHLPLCFTQRKKSKHKTS